jgi:hypothetical protein
MSRGRWIILCESRDFAMKIGCFEKEKELPRFHVKIGVADRC